jgi:hypothetical protein
MPRSLSLRERYSHICDAYKEECVQAGRDLERFRERMNILKWVLKQV